MPRKRKEISLDRVGKLAAMGCTMEEIAAVEGVCKTTLERNEAAMEYINNGRLKVSASIKRKQYQVAMRKGDKTMLIWLGKQYCGQTDRSDQTIDHTHRYYIQGPAPAEDADAWQQQYSPKATSRQMQ